jgi:sugar O-acyltransferase (sialic acid O-acetyltransferase NeuD family)
MKALKKALVGNGGFARDIRALLGTREMISFIDDQYYRGERCTAPLSAFDPREYELFVTVASPRARAEIVSRLPEETRFFNVIHPSAQLLLRDGITIGTDCVISAGCLLVDNIHIGDHCHLNLGTILGHDVTLGDYFTSAPGVKIMGNNIIGNRVYFGTGAQTKEKITVADDVTVGLGAGVVHNLMEAGTYVGTPARRIK